MRVRAGLWSDQLWQDGTKVKFLCMSKKNHILFHLKVTGNYISCIHWELTPFYLSLPLTDSWTGCFCGQGQASHYGQSRLSRNRWQHSTSIWEPENNRKPGQWLSLLFVKLKWKCISAPFFAHFIVLGIDPTAHWLEICDAHLHLVGLHNVLNPKNKLKSKLMHLTWRWYHGKAMFLDGNTMTLWNTTTILQ